MKLNPKNIGKIIVLSGINPAFISALFNSPDPNTLLMAFLMTAMQSFVLYLLVSQHNGQPRWSLVWKATLIFYGTTFFQANIEAILFLNYMQNTMSNAQIHNMLMDSLLGAAVVGPVAVFLFWEEKEVAPSDTLPLKNILLRGTGLSFLYMVIYIVFGALVFKPIAGEHYETYYGQLQIPSWLFPFQVVRGGLWTLIAWGTMSIITGTRKQVVWTIAAVLAVPITSLLLPGNDIMPAPIRLGHFIEICSSMLVFGLLAGWILTRPVKEKG